MDYVGVKRFDANGKLVGEFRIVGLFTSTAYTALDRARSPICAARSTRCSTRAGFDPDGHSGKALVNVLETYPRDELFQIDEDTLYRLRARDPAARRAAARARAAAARPLRPLRLGARLRAARPLRQRRAQGDRRLSRRAPTTATSAPSIRSSRKARWCACISSSAAAEGDDARSRPRRRSKPRSTAIVRTWTDGLGDALAAAHEPAKARALFERYREAFSEGYREAYSPPTRGRRHPRDRGPVADAPARRRLPSPRRATTAATASASRSGATAGRSRCRSACRCWRTWASGSSTSAPIEIAAGRPDEPDVWFHDMMLERADGGAVDLDGAQAGARSLLPRGDDRRRRERRLQRARCWPPG